MICTEPLCQNPESFFTSLKGVDIATKANLKSLNTTQCAKRKAFGVNVHVEQIATFYLKSCLLLEFTSVLGIQFPYKNASHISVIH